MPIRLVVLIACCAGIVLAQINTGTIVGDVVDPQGFAVNGAEATLVSEATGDARKTVTNETGTFRFPAVPAGAYTLRISMQGFQTFERRGIVLTSTEYLSAGSIALTLGSTTEMISVNAQAAVVQTASAESSSVLNSRQVSQILARGRDVTTLLRLMPGVQQTADSATMGGRIGTSTPSIAGLRTGTTR